MIIITSKKDGFRRCGVAHLAEPTEYANDRFSKEELAVLRAEPMLTVVDGKEKPAKPEKKA